MVSPGTEPPSPDSYSRPPVPKFKYIDNPRQYKRDYAYRQSPFEGDFCVMSVDHVASVADLGLEAMEAAKRIPSGQYVAYVGMSISLPFNNNPTNPFNLAPICQGVPRQAAYCDNTPACIPIHPSSEVHGGREPLKPVAPFPWPDCYISTFDADSCRVTNVKREYPPVLCVLDDMANAEADTCIYEDREEWLAFQTRRNRGNPDALARMPLKPRPTPVEGPSADPLSFLPPLQVDRPGSRTAPTPSDLTGGDSVRSAIPVHTAVPSSLFSTGSPSMPVVNIWYDLTMVTEVPDPAEFTAECEMLRKLRAYYHPKRVALRAKAEAQMKQPASTGVGRETIPPSLPTVTASTPGADALASRSLPTNVTPIRPHLSATGTEEVHTAARPLESTTQEAVSLSLPSAGRVDATARQTGSQSSLVALRKSMYRSESRSSLRSSKAATSLSASPTKKEFTHHPHPYAVERSTRSASSLSFAVPRLRNDSLKSLKKSRSSSSLKIPRRAAALPALPFSRSLR
ncbi:unnamed protein product [Peniophora sp. CBMAI 1063]|nr:unnamed protein product [Peniophora sp. CBMAI 1063]